MSTEPVVLPSHHELDGPIYAPPHGCTFCGHLEKDHGTHEFRGHTEPACGGRIAFSSYDNVWRQGWCGCVGFNQ